MVDPVNWRVSGIRYNDMSIIRAQGWPRMSAIKKSSQSGMLSSSKDVEHSK